MRITLYIIVLLGVIMPVAGLIGHKKEGKGYQFSKHFEKNARENLMILLLPYEKETLLFTFREFTFGKYRFLPKNQSKKRLTKGEILHPKSRLV